MSNILYLRHGESESNVAGTFSGMRDDTVLTGRGEEQARQAGHELVLAGTRIDRIIASPLARAQRTAYIVAEAIGFDPSGIETAQGLAEYDMGDLTGTLKVSVTSAQLIAAKGAEDPTQFMRRVASVLDGLEGYRGTVLLVAHAGVGRVIRCYKEGLDPAGFYDLPGYPNAKTVSF